MKIDGEYNSASVKAVDLDESAIDQIQEMVNTDSFEGDDNIVIMPDAHWGSGAVIGFTMPIGSRLVPNTIGVDIGCGMLAVNLPTDDRELTDDLLSQIDAAIRKRVPMGFNVHGSLDFHVHDNFPWDECQRKLDTFNEHSQLGEIDTEYGPEYFDELVRRVGYDPTRAINSIGTLGGGNHFIEIGEAAVSGDVWCIIHSGSRGIGGEIAKYWQKKATNLTTRRKATLDTVPDDVVEYMNEDWKPKKGAIRADFEGEEIQEMFNKVSRAIQEHGPSASHRNTDLDYLEGEETHGYISDMIFAQTYASLSREVMANSVLNAWSECGLTEREGFDDVIESVHNFIDFEDQTIRKGSCRSYDGERIVIPMNMSFGTLLCRGKSNTGWNNSAPHGAGRAMSRTEAKNRYSHDDFKESTKGVFMSEYPLDEIPGAYKDPTGIQEAIGPTAEVEDHVIPFLNLKAE